MKKAKKYLREKNLHNSHWGEIIIAAEKRGHFSTNNHLHSSDWFSCACGQLNEKIRKSSDGVPLDFDLNFLGNVFCNMVGKDYFLGAAETLYSIEQREKELLNGVE